MTTASGAEDKTTSNTSRPIFVFTHPRVASNLFVHLFADNPQIAQLTYLFFEAFYQGPDAISQHKDTKVATTVEEQNTHATYQQAFDAITQFVKATQSQGKVPLLKEHVYYMIKPSVIALHVQQYTSRPPPFIQDTHPDADNPSLLPTTFLTSVSPTFMIRHPARFIPSFYRAMVRTIPASELPMEETQWPLDFSFKCSCILYDYYAKHLSITPLVIDGDDLVNHPQEIVDVFCTRNDLDKSKVRYEWDVVPLKTDTPHARLVTAFRGTLNSSKGVNKGEEPLKAPILSEEVELWKKEFGDDLAGKFKSYVEATMDDYLYLYNLRIRVGTNFKE